MIVHIKIQYLHHVLSTLYQIKFQGKPCIRLIISLCVVATERFINWTLPWHYLHKHPCVGQDVCGAATYKYVLHFDVSVDYQL